MSVETGENQGETRDKADPGVEAQPRLEKAAERLLDANLAGGLAGAKRWIQAGMAAFALLLLLSLWRRNWTLLRVAAGFFFALLERLQEAALADRMLEKARGEASERLAHVEEPFDVTYRPEEHLEL